jgi:hypothetical protein
MPLTVNRFKAPVGPTEVRHRLVVETEPCLKGTLHSRMIRQELLRYVADDPFFSQCGGIDFEQAKLRHDGTRWVMEFESVVAKS